MGAMGIHPEQVSESGTNGEDASSGEEGERESDAEEGKGRNRMPTQRLPAVNPPRARNQLQLHPSAEEFQ